MRSPVSSYVGFILITFILTYFICFAAVSLVPPTWLPLSVALSLTIVATVTALIGNC